MDTQAQQFHDEWESRYQAQKTGWDRGQVSPALLRWLDSGQLKPCRILVPGCGNGYEVLALAKLGFDVVGVDIAPTPVQKLRTQLSEQGLQADIIQTDLLAWQPEQPFTAIYEQTCLCALNPDYWQQYEACLHNWLVTGGQLLAQFMQIQRAGGPPYHCEISVMRDLFPTSRWDWHTITDNLIQHPNNLAEIQYLLLKK